MDILEKIDAYLTGEMTGEMRSNFEEQISANPGLSEQVQHQQQLIQAAKRKVLRAQINSVAVGAVAGGSSMSIWTWVLSSIVGVGLITGAVFFFMPEEEALSENVTEEIVEKEPITVYTEESQLIQEQPETIFSSTNNYQAEEFEESYSENTISHNASLNTNTELEIESSTVSSERNETVTTSIDQSEIKSEAVANQPDVIINADISEDLLSDDRSKRASYPDGHGALQRFIEQRLTYPETAKSKRLQGLVKCEFFVSADGVIGEIDAKCMGLSDEMGMPLNEMKRMVNKRSENAFVRNAMHVLRSMPKWSPATNSDGNPIVSIQNMYFNYNLERGCIVFQLEDEQPSKFMGGDGERYEKK